jgi:PHD/YefM family antitoxin component YafN of YafNO toxin-antitoxin module
MRRNMVAVFSRIKKRREHTVIKNNGDPIAVLLPMEEYERLMAYERLAAFDDFARQLGQEIEKQGLSEEQLLADFENTKRKVAEARYGQIG